jgi:hypothetical protein
MMLVIFVILMCSASLTLYETMVMAIYIQCPYIELVSPICSCNCETYYEYPVERTYVDTAMNIGFKFAPNQDKPRGILMYKVQRKRGTKFSHRSIIGKTIEEALKMLRLLIIWKIGSSGQPKANIMLVEYDNKLDLNEDKPVQLYNKVNDMPSTNTWLMYDNTALEVAYKVMHGEDIELNITISQGRRSQNNIRPMLVDLERQVLSLMEIYLYSFMLLASLYKQ